jgi:cell division protein FtsL
VTALGKLVRTTAFKIVAVYLLVFALFAAVVIVYLARHTQQLVVAQITETVDAEVRGLQEQYRIGGINRLVAVVETRVTQPGSNL